MTNKKNESQSISSAEELDAIFREGLQNVPEKYLQMDWVGLSRLLSTKRKGPSGISGTLIISCFLVGATYLGIYLLKPASKEHEPVLTEPIKPKVELKLRYTQPLRLNRQRVIQTLSPLISNDKSSAPEIREAQTPLFQQGDKEQDQSKDSLAGSNIRQDSLNYLIW